MVIHTQRLELVPLTAVLLRAWLEDISSLETQLQCTYRAEPLEGDFLRIVKGQLLKTETCPEDYPWRSFWLFIRKCDRIVIGSADFKDSPNDACEVDIGYGLADSFTGHGYMTEAVTAMCKWALNSGRVLHVTAQTDLDGYASQRVLQRCGFVEQRRDENGVYWRL